jgi:hypothetical protein
MCNNPTFSSSSRSRFFDSLDILVTRCKPAVSQPGPPSFSINRCESARAVLFFVVTSHGLFFKGVSQSLIYTGKIAFALPLWKSGCCFSHPLPLSPQAIWKLDCKRTAKTGFRRGFRLPKREGLHCVGQAARGKTLDGVVSWERPTVGLLPREDSNDIVSQERPSVVLAGKTLGDGIAHDDKNA